MSSARTAPLALLTVLVLLTAAPAHAFSTPQEVSGNTIWSWWTSPTAAVSGSTLHFTGVDSEGRQQALSHDGVALDATDLSTENEADDHNAPALSMIPGHPTLTFYTGHPGTMRYRTAPASTIDFGAERTVPWGFDGTYAQVLRDRHRVIVLTRGPSNTWWSITSPDSGGTWAQPRLLFDGASIGQPYVLLRAFDGDPLRFHLAAYRNPAGSPENLIGYRTISFQDIWDGRGVGFAHSSLEVVWRPPAGRGYRFRLLDIGDKNGRTLVYYARWNADTPTPQYYTAVRGPAGWTSTKIISAGATLYDAPNKYVGGITLDRRPGVARFYLAHRDENTGRWVLATYRVDGDGLPYLRVVLDTGTLPLARPVSVGDGVLYQQIVTYTGFTNYRARAWYIEDVAR